MSQSAFIGSLAAAHQAGRVVSLPHRRPDQRSRQRELEQKLSALQKDHADLHAALFEAAQAHRRICAPRLLRFGSFRVASEIFAVRQLPGDFFITHNTARGVVLALGDVCGKGLAAGMWVTLVTGLVTTHAATSLEPQEILYRVNRDFCRTSSVPLTSVFLATLDLPTGVLHYCSAGHPPPLLLRVNGNMQSLSEGGPLLGVIPSASFEPGRVHLDCGDVLVAYSDGVLDSVNSSGEDFGYERLKRQLQDAGKGNADSVLFSLLGAVQDFAGGCPLEDDLSLVVLRRNPQKARDQE